MKLLAIPLSHQKAVTKWLVISQTRRLILQTRKKIDAAREAVLAATHGIVGDFLAATDNPLAIPSAHCSNTKGNAFQLYNR